MNGSSKRTTAFACVAVLVLVTNTGATAASLGSYPFTGNANPTGAAVGLSLSTFTAGAGLQGVSTASNQHSSYHWNGANLVAAQTNNDYVTFTITPTAGYFVELASIGFKHTKGHNQSPDSFAILVNGSQVGTNVVTPGNDTSQHTDSRSPGLTNQTVPLVVQFVGWNGGTQSNRTLLFDDITITGNTIARASLNASIADSPDARVMLNTANVQYSIDVVNDALTAGTAATQGLNYSLDLSGATGFSVDAPSTGTNFAPASIATHFVSVDTTSTGLKSGTLTVTGSNAWRANGNVGNTITSPALDSVAVVSQRAVTASLVDLGTVIEGANVNGVSNLATTGSDNERTRITLASGLAGSDGNGIALISSSGSLFNSADDIGTRTLDGIIAGNGLVNGSFDLSVVGEQLAGEAAYADILVNYSATVLAHSDGEFNNISGVGASFLTNANDNLLIDFGTVVQGSGILNVNFDLFAKNVAAMVSDLEIDAFTGALTQGAISLSGNTSFTGLTANSAQTYQVSLDTATTGTFNATFIFHLSDEDLLGASAEQSQTMTLTVTGVVELDAPSNPIVPEPSTGILGILGLTLVFRRQFRRTLRSGPLPADPSH